MPSPLPQSILAASLTLLMAIGGGPAWWHCSHHGSDSAHHGSDTRSDRIDGDAFGELVGSHTGCCHGHAPAATTYAAIAGDRAARIAGECGSEPVEGQDPHPEPSDCHGCRVATAGLAASLPLHPPIVARLAVTRDVPPTIRFSGDSSPIVYSARGPPAA